MAVDVAREDQADRLRSLREWLAAEDELRGRVRLVEAAPPAGSLGTVPELITVMVAQGGVLTVLAGALITWLRQRKSDLTIKVTHGESSLEITATSVRGLDVDGVRAEVDRAAGHLTELVARSGTPDASSGMEPGRPPTTGWVLEIETTAGSDPRGVTAAVEDDPSGVTAGENDPSGGAEGRDGATGRR